MTQSQYARREHAGKAETCFKRHILNQSSVFAADPMADLYRINLLGMMLNRYDEFISRGMTELSAIQRTEHEFADIRQRMLEAGFEESKDDPVRTQRWPQMTEDEAAEYIQERRAMINQRSLGIAMCVACVVPLFLGTAVLEVWDFVFFILLGLIGMLGMIAGGIYAMITAKKPEHDKKVRGGHFSLAERLRSKLKLMQEAAEEKSRRRTGKGIALIVTSLAPLFLGCAFLDVWNNAVGPLLGLVGMFLMIAAGVYQLCMGSGEKKTMSLLLGKKSQE